MTDLCVWDRATFASAADTNTTTANGGSSTTTMQPTALIVPPPLSFSNQNNVELEIHVRQFDGRRELRYRLRHGEGRLRGPVPLARQEALSTGRKPIAVEGTGEGRGPGHFRLDKGNLQTEVTS